MNKDLYIQLLEQQIEQSELEEELKVMIAKLEKRLEYRNSQLAAIEAKLQTAERQLQIERLSKIPTIPSPPFNPNSPVDPYAPTWSSTLSSVEENDLLGEIDFTAIDKEMEEALNIFLSPNRSTP